MTRLSAVALRLLVIAVLTGAAAFSLERAYAVFTDAPSVPSNTLTTDTLDPPTGTTATPGSSAGTIDIGWTATVDGYASGYRVYQGTTSGGPYSQIAEVTPRTTTTYTDSPAAGTYYYVVRSFFQNWESVNSNEDSATVTPPAVTFDASTWGGSTAVSNTVTVSHTTGSISASSIILALITYDARDDETVASVTWDTGGGDPTFTLVAGSRFGTGTTAASEIWYALAPAASTTATMTVTFQTGEQPRGPNVVAMSLDGVDQATPFDSASGDTSESASVSTTVSSAADDMVVDVVSDYRGSSVGTIGAGQTLRASGQSYPGDPRNYIMTSTEPGAASNVTMSWTNLDDNQVAAQSAVNIKAEGAGALPGSVGILDAWTTGTTHTVSAGTDRLLLVGVYGEDSGVINSVNTVTWGGQTLTEINEVALGGGFSNLVWMGYLNDAGIAAASGSTIIATWSGGTPDESVLYSAVTLENVDQTTPVGDSSTGTATSASSVQIGSSLSVDTSDMAVYVTASGAQGQTHTAATGYTEGTEQDSGGSGQVASNATKAITASGSEQPTAAWSGTNNRLAIVGAVIKVSPSGSSSVGILDAWTTGTTHTVSAGTDRLLLVGVYGEDTGAINSINTVTWGGQTLTEISEAVVGSGFSNLVWMGYLKDAGIAAASGSTIVATWSGSTPDNSVLYAAVTLENVDQTTPVGGSSTGTNTSASTVQIASSLSVDTSDMAVYVTVIGQEGLTHTADTGYTEGTEQDSGGSGQVASNATKAITANGNEQPTATWSTSFRVAIIGAVINVAP